MSCLFNRQLIKKTEIKGRGMKGKLIVIALLAFLYVPAGSAQAAGTASGTSIINTATATYTDGGTVVTKTASTTIVVDNKVNLTVTKNADVEVIPAATDQALVFVVRNDGNTPQRYALTAINGAGIVMDNVRIYLDNGPNPGALDPTDTLYVDAATFGDVAADGTLAILIVADTPGTATTGQTSDYHLLATTMDAGTTTLTLPTVGAGTTGVVDVVFADIAGSEAGDTARDGKHSAIGIYSINALLLEIAKSAVISSDPTNGTTNPKAIPGATIIYTITVTVTGVGTATNVIITDPIPANSTYTGTTLMLNGVAQTDGADGDPGSVGGVPVTVTVNLGDMTSVSVVQTITFEVVINL